MKRQLRNLSVRKRMFISYLFIFIVPVLIMGAVTYQWMYNVTVSQVEDSYKKNLSTIIQTIDQRIQSLDSFAIQLSQTRWVSKLMYMYGSSIDPALIDPVSLKDYSEEFRLYTVANEFIESIGVYYHSKNLVLSTFGRDTFPWFVEEGFKVNELSVEDWTAMTREYNDGKILNPVTLERYDHQKEGLVYLHSLPVGKYQGIKATLIAFINVQSINTLLNNLIVDRDGSVYILDEHDHQVAGHVLSEKDKEFIQNHSFDSTLVTATSYSQDNEERMIFLSQSEKNNWKYAVTIPAASVAEKIKHVQTIVLLLVFVSSGLGVWLSYELSRRSYKPLERIVKLFIHDAPPAEGSARNNEFMWLENNIQKLLIEENQLKKRMEKSHPILKNGYLLKLLTNDNHTRQEALRGLQLLGIDFPYPFFTCIVIVAHHASVSEAITNRALDCSNRCKTIVYSAESTEQIILVVNYEEKSRKESLITAFSNACKDLAEHKFSVGVGSSSDMNSLHLSYLTACTAADYRLYKNEDRVIRYEEVLKEELYYFYPLDKEIHITNHLKSGNYDDAAALFQEILQENLGKATAKATSINALRYFFFNAELTAIRLIEERGLTSVIQLSSNHIFRLDTIDDMKAYILTIYHELCEAVNNGKESHNYELKQKIEQYIENHYRDSSISLSGIADKFNLSSSYLSRYFREQFGYNYTDYVNRMRIEAAKRILMEDKQVSINQIAQDIGYDNDVTFRRVFKKYTGVAPSQYKGNLLEKPLL
ncbi:helix-turn-helix domain-containing protein [Paenibacillus sp. J5C_2022]|uniref:helix-turn-helix domain-containing protein n=1 Tax=Paenibacillus sp. J5C2022 TaxID=2977129 RepID=UPI0021D3C551|nr:helix-turn-helix domain-containing protein [Paenibacillus sp. J5C2022]MCU6710196.1 helix-turn-helix domain-containing protein [Paenibacillus sp. J5C2022]